MSSQQSERLSYLNSGKALPATGLNRVSHSKSYLKIGDVARLVGISPSAIRSWEHLGLTHPARTKSRYRLYSNADVYLLKKARYLRKAQGLNAPAIVQRLKQNGMIQSKVDGASHSIGLRLRQLRVSRGLRLAQVAAQVGVSVGFLSAIERSQMSASITTLRKLSRFYQSNILDLFDPRQTNPGLVRPSDRRVLEAGPGVRMELLAWGSTVLEPHLFRIAPQAGSGGSYAHEGEEFLFVLRGELNISLARRKYHLKRGDSFYFDSTIAHRWANPNSRDETWVLWINTPLTF